MQTIGSISGMDVEFFPIERSTVRSKAEQRRIEATVDGEKCPEKGAAIFADRAMERAKAQISRPGLELNQLAGLIVRLRDPDPGKCPSIEDVLKLFIPIAYSN
jgi:hypothetical protein